MSRIVNSRRNGAVLAAAVLVAAGCGGEAPDASDDRRFRKYAAGIGAHHLCSGVFVVGRVTERSPETVLADDIQIGRAHV